VASIFRVNLIDFNGKIIFYILVVSLIFLFGLFLDLRIQVSFLPTAGYLLLSVAARWSDFLFGCLYLHVPWSRFFPPPITFYFRLQLSGRSELASLIPVDWCARSGLGFLFFASVFLTGS
jgi:hypothetical protein